MDVTGETGPGAPEMIDPGLAAREDREAFDAETSPAEKAYDQLLDLTEKNRPPETVSIEVPRELVDGSTLEPAAPAPTDETPKVASTEVVDKRPILDLEPIRQLVECDREIERIQDELDKAKEKREKLAELCQSNFATAGLRSVPLEDADGYPCSVHLSNKFIVNKREEITTEMVCDVLKAVGLDWMVKPAYPAATLKSWVVEQLALGNELPKGITDSFVLLALDDVRVVRTSRKESQTAKAARKLRSLNLPGKKK